MMQRRASTLILLLVCTVAAVWALPFLWMLVAAIAAPDGHDPASFWPGIPTTANVTEAWQSGNFILWYANTLFVCLGLLAVQCVTVTCAGYAFARLRFPGQSLIFTAFLLQLLLVPTILIVPNLTMLVHLHLYDTLLGIMAPYMASAFGVFLMRQTFRTLPRDYEDAALIDGASRMQIIWHVLLPLARPGLAAFAIVSVTAHWNEFLWPLMATTSPEHQVLTVGLASFASGAESGDQWCLIAAGTCLVSAPLLLLFLIFQRRFVASFAFTGIK